MAIISATCYEEVCVFSHYFFSVVFCIRNLLYPVGASSFVCPQEQSNPWNPTELNWSRNLMSFSSILLYCTTLAIEKPMENCQFCRTWYKLLGSRNQGWNPKTVKEHVTGKVWWKSDNMYLWREDILISNFSLIKELSVSDKLIVWFCFTCP